MIVRRCMIRVSELAAFLAAGYVEIFRLPSGWRLDAPAAIVEWSGDGPPPEID